MITAHLFALFRRSTAAMAPPTRISKHLALLLTCLLCAAAHPAAALPAAAGDADAGPPDADAGVPISPEEQQLAAELDQQRAHIEALIAGTLDPSVDAAQLFQVDISSPQRIALERARLRRLLELPPQGESPQGGSAQGEPPTEAGSAGAAASSGSAATPPRTNPRRERRDPVWQARERLDRAQLHYLELEPARQKQLLAEHQARRDQAHQLRQAAALSEAERAAEKAKREKQEALEAAAHATSEAVRLLNEERAHLLEVTQKQADFEQQLILKQAALEQRTEKLLGWRRKVKDVLDSGTRRDPVFVDAVYVDLKQALSEASTALETALDGFTHDVSGVPHASATRLDSLPAEVDQTPVVKQRLQVAEKTQQLQALEDDFYREQARQLMAEVETLNRLRLSLLPHLSSGQRDRAMGFAMDGFRQAASEIKQVVLVLRYHLHALYDWVRAMARSGERRRESVWIAVWLIVKWAIPLALFWWWRGRADRILLDARERIREGERKSRKPWLGASTAERALVVIQRIRKPAEVLLLVIAIRAMLPLHMAALLEVQVLSTVLLWVFGSAVAVHAIDALSEERNLRSGRTSRSGSSYHESLRLRSLRLVSRATVTFGLILSLSDLLVGKGTVYSWVFSTCWFAALPLLVTLISWWRPTIFERLERQRKRNAFEEWALAQTSGLPGALAAVAAGLYLFGRGAVRAVHAWVVDFRVMRHFLAYLFRRDLSRKAQDAGSPCRPIARDLFESLGPEANCELVLDAVLGPQVKEVSARIQEEGGGTIAVVGERGSGKSTLVSLLSKEKDEVVSVRCRQRGLEAFTQDLNRSAGFPADTSLGDAIRRLDSRAGDSALVIDDAGQLIRPEMGGLRDFDELLNLCRLYSTRCTWILAIDQALWRFLESSRGARPIFDYILVLRGWTEEHIVELLQGRNQASGITPSFERLLLALPDDADEIDRQEALRRTETNYYRLLWDYAAGNPSVALHVWRRSLGIDQNGRLQVQLFDTVHAEDLESLPDSAVFVLRAIVQLGWSTAEEVRRATNLPMPQVLDVLRYGGARGYFHHDQNRYRISWDWFRAVTRLLERRHLILAPERS